MPLEAPLAAASEEVSWAIGLLSAELVEKPRGRFARLLFCTSMLVLACVCLSRSEWVTVWSCSCCLATSVFSLSRSVCKLLSSEFGTRSNLICENKIVEIWMDRFLIASC